MIGRRAILTKIGAEQVAPLVGQTFSLAESVKAHLAIEIQGDCRHDARRVAVTADL